MQGRWMKMRPVRTRKRSEKYQLPRIPHEDSAMKMAWPMMSVCADISQALLHNSNSEVALVHIQEMTASQLPIYQDYYQGKNKRFIGVGGNFHSSLEELSTHNEPAHEWLMML